MSSGERRCRSLVRERSQGLCELCGKPGDLTLHHRKKRSQGGGWTASNCVMLDGHGTAGCHGWVEDHPVAAEIEGFHVRPWQDPAVVPVFYMGQGWADLTEDGGVAWRT